MSPTFPRLIRPGLHLTPFLAGELASALSLAIERFQLQGLTVRDIGRLHAAVAQLRKVEVRNSLGTDPADLKATALASALASDFHLIADTLQDYRQDPITKDIKVALGGTLSGDDPDSEPYEYQSQYWVGVLLTQAGLKPGVLDWETRRPDFVVRVHDMPCGVEAKRPRNLEAAKRLMKHATTQLTAANVPGVIAVDLSAVIDTNSYILPRPGRHARTEIRRLQSELATALADFIRHYPRPEKFGHLMSLVTFARFQVFTTLTPPLTDSGFVFSINRFDTAYHGQVVRYADEFEERLQAGMARISNNPVQIERT